MNGISSISYVNNNIKRKNVSQPCFRAETEANIDTLELNNKKEEDPYKYHKYGLYTVAGLSVVGLAAGFLVKGMHKKVEQLYKEKLVISNLPESIKFEAAKTLDEAKNFAKNILGIKHVDDNFTLEALNYANKSIVDVSNVNKGKLYIPSALKYNSLEENTLAYVDANVRSKSFGELVINKDYFEDDFLSKCISKHLKDKNGKNLFAKSKDDEYICLGRVNELRPIFLKELTPIMDKYYANPQLLSLEEKLTLKKTIADMFHQSKIEANPNLWLKRCEKIIKDNNYILSLDEYQTKKTNKERAEYLKQVIKTLREECNHPISITIRKGSPEKTIYHEMGHLQDFGKNLKDIDMKQLETMNLNLIDNRWGGLGYEDCEKIWNKDKEEFKQKFPDLYEFLTNEESQQTAGKISSYAQTGIGEYIAETYALMVDAKLHNGKIADDIIALYKKYNGPMIN